MKNDFLSSYWIIFCLVYVVLLTIFYITAKLENEAKNKNTLH